MKTLNEHETQNNVQDKGARFSNDTLAVNLREFRTAKGESASSIAKKLGVSKSLYSYWEHGKSRPTEYHLIKLADHFGCTTDALTGPVNSEQEQVIQALLDRTKEEKIKWKKVNERDPSAYAGDEEVDIKVTRQFLEEFNSNAQDPDKKKAVQVPESGVFITATIGKRYFLFEKIVGLGYTSKGIAIYDTAQYENKDYEPTAPIVITSSSVSDLYKMVYDAHNNAINAYEKSKLQEALKALNEL